MDNIKKIIFVLLTLPLTGLSYANPSSRSNANPINSSKSASGDFHNLNQVNSASAVQPEVNADKVVLNFENADVQSVIKAISKLSGKNFVIDPRVKGTVNIVSDKPISKADSYKVLESALRMQGFAAVEADGVIKVLPENEAKTYGMQTEGSASLGKRRLGDQVVTKVFVIQHGSAMQLANSLRPLIAPNNAITVYPNSNALIVTDYASNIVRINKIISQLSDSGISIEPVVITLQNAIAADVARILQSYLTGGSGASGGAAAGVGQGEGPAATITVEPATNSIIIYSPIQDKVQELKALAQKLDRNVGSSNSNLHVVYLKNADASHIADVLRVVANNQENPDLTASSSLAKFTTEPTAVFQSSGSGGTTGSSGGGFVSSSSIRPASSSSKPSGSNAATQKDAPKIVVQAEPTTNSLIIQAPVAIYKNLRMIIDMLDVRRAQVQIEAMLANVSEEMTGNFGIQWLVGGGNNNIGAIGIGNYAGAGNSITNLATNAIAAAKGIAGKGEGQTNNQGLTIPGEMYVGVVTANTQIGGQTLPGLGAIADMLAANNLGNVLSRPTLITLDNEEARIMVGSNIPLPNGSFQNTASSAAALVTTVSRQDLGTVLQIKPLITQSGAIQLDIYQEDSQVDQATISNSNGANINKKTMRTTVLVDDGQIIAMGGMTEDTVSSVKRGIPLLSDIPYLGWLFSWQSRQHTKTNLVLFLRPTIIKNADGYKALTNQRYSYIVGEQKQIQASGNLLLPTLKPVTLDNQVPYSKLPAPESGPALNLNNNLPIIDLTADGKNINNSTTAAVTTTTTTKVTPPGGVANTSSTTTLDKGWQPINLK